MCAGAEVGGYNGVNYGGAGAYNGTNYNGGNFMNRFNGWGARYSNIDTYQKIFTNIDTYMRGYVPNAAMNEIVPPAADANIAENENTVINANKSNKVKEKAQYYGKKSEEGIDKVREFLTNLYLRFTNKNEKKEPIYDAQDVATQEETTQDVSSPTSPNTPSANLETQEVNNSAIENKKDETLSEQVDKKIENVNKQEDKKEDAKEDESAANKREDLTNLESLTSEQKLELIRKVIDEDIFKIIREEYSKVFDQQEVSAPQAQTAPLPSPFDPSKIDEQNEAKSNA